MDNALEQAIRLQRLLKSLELKVVFAESCTAGRIAATLGALPGISSQLCGCFVVYRNDSKQHWLGIDPQHLLDPAIGPVSAQVTADLASAALARTPEADLAVAITGEIGPGAGDDVDGQIYLALEFRAAQSSAAQSSAVKTYAVKTYAWSTKLHSSEPNGPVDFNARIARLNEATTYALRTTADCLESALGENV